LTSTLFVVWTQASFPRVGSVEPVVAKEYRFGRVAAGKIVAYSFILDNPSRYPVRVTGVGTSCACTTANQDFEEVPAKGSVPLPVEVRTLGRGGPIRETILVSLSDGRRLSFLVSGYVEPDHVALIEFGLIQKGMDASRSFELLPAPDVSLDVVELRYPSEVVDVAATTRNSTPSALAFEVRSGNEIPYGPFDGTIEIVTTDPFKPVKTARFIGSVAFPLRVEPEQIGLGLMVPGERVNGETRIISPYGQAIKVEGVRIVEGEQVE
jgi:hypothetical protein